MIPRRIKPQLQSTGDRGAQSEEAITRYGGWHPRPGGRDSKKTTKSLIIKMKKVNCRVPHAGARPPVPQVQHRPVL